MIRIIANTITGDIREEQIPETEIAEIEAKEFARLESEALAEAKRAEAIAKLETLGLTADDIRAILG